MKKYVTVSYLILTLFIGTSTATLGVSHDETVDGDLSGDRDNPTVLSLDPGDNLLSGTMGALDDVDFVTVNIAEGFQLDALFFEDYTGEDGLVSFLGMQAGTAWTEGIGDDIQPANLMGWTHLAIDQVGSDILGDIGTAPGTEEFIPPFPNGDYTLLLQEQSDRLGYTLNFSVSASAVPVPEASSTLVLLAMSMITMVGIGSRYQIRHSRAGISR